MIEVTPAAQVAIRRLLEEKGLSGPIRVFLQAGCGGSQLAMGLDQPRPSDTQVEIDGYVYLIDKGLAESVGEVKVDYLADAYVPGFAITSARPLPTGCAGCSC